MSLICSVILSLVVDTSMSIDNREYRLQMEGMARAFRNERVLSAIESSGRPIAINLIFFSTEATVQIPWTLVRNTNDSYSLATRIESLPRTQSEYTNVRAAVNLSINDFTVAPCESDTMFIDISGDGVHNVGPDVFTEEQLAERALYNGIRINALPILENDEAKNESLYNYYNNLLVQPTGGFVIRATSFENFGDAFVRKLHSELAMR